MRRIVIFIIILLNSCWFAGNTHAQQNYGVHLSTKFVDSVANAHFIHFMEVNLLTSTGKKTYVNAVTQIHNYHPQTWPFYFTLLIVLILAIFKKTNEEYFSTLFGAFSSSGNSNRQLRDQLDQNGAANLIMNFFSFVVIGIYFYAIARHNHWFQSNVPDIIILSASIVTLSCIYTVKYIGLKFSGWTFGLEPITDAYIYNVFLVNKMLGIILIPFIFIISFGVGAWVEVMVTISYILIALMLLSRYLRSLQAFDSFLQLNKFHFFMYFCTSEILPIALVIKIAITVLGKL